MAAFGAIMQFYDPLRSFPLWGYGDQVRKPLCLQHPAHLHVHPSCAHGVHMPGMHKYQLILLRTLLCSWEASVRGRGRCTVSCMQGKSKCWALNGQQFQPEVKGLRGLLRTYRLLAAVCLSTMSNVPKSLE